MAWGKGQEPSFERTQVLLADVKEEAKKNTHWTSFATFVAFLETLDPNKTAIFYVEENGTHSGRRGYQVVHFNEKAEEKWYDSWGQTWFGISAWMS